MWSTWVGGSILAALNTFNVSSVYRPLRAPPSTTHKFPTHPCNTKLTQTRLSPLLLPPFGFQSMWITRADYEEQGDRLFVEGAI
jgi:hypothetical protein